MSTDAQIAGGHKANINNPNTSEESKQHSREVLDSGNFESAGKSEGEKNPNNSEEAKQSAKERLEGM